MTTTGFQSIFEKHLDALIRKLWAEATPGWAFDPEDEVRVQTEQWKEREGCNTCGHGESIRSEIHLIVGDRTLATYDDLGGLIRALDAAVPASLLTCETCHKTAPDVRDREDPYRADVHDEHVIMRLCDSCTQDRRDDI